MAESGVQQPEDIAEYRRWGADVVLVGEALVRAGNPQTSIQVPHHSEQQGQRP